MTHFTIITSSESISKEILFFNAMFIPTSCNQERNNKKKKL